MNGRFHRTLVVVSILVTPFLIWAAIQAQTNTDDVNNWVDRTSSEYAAYLDYTKHFGSDDEIIISWDGCATDDDRLALAATYLRRQCAPWLERVVSGTEALRDLRRSASKFSNTSARKRLRGSLFGDDLKTTCLIARLNANGRADLDRVLQTIDNTIVSYAGVERDQLHYGGKAITDHALNALTNRSLWWGIPGSVIAALIALACVRNVRLTVGMLFVASLASLTSLALVPLFGYQVNGLLVLMPVLVFVLTLGCAVHMVRALQRNLDAGQSTPDYAIRQSLEESRPPVILSMLTTAIGIGSLALSPLSAVFQLGVFAAASIFIAMLMLTFLLPAIWIYFGTGQRSGTSRRTPPATHRLADMLIGLNRYPAVILVLFLLVVIPPLTGIRDFETDLEASNLFAATTDYAQDRAWIEENLYPLGRVDFVVSFPKAKQNNRFRQLRYIQRIQTAIREDAFYHSALSAANFVRVPRSNSPFQRQLTEQLIATQIDHDYDQLNEEGMLYSNTNDDQWRIVVVCEIDDDHDERDHADRMLQLAVNTLDDNPDEVRIGSTGMGPLAANGQRRLFSDLTRGLVTALILITPLIIISLRSLHLGLLAMIPNLFPIVMVFGYYGLLGHRLDAGSILTASVGLGIAIDDTVHFLHYYKMGRSEASAELSARETRQFGVRHAIQRCAWPIVTTSLIICCGMFFFTFSDFLPVRNFAISLTLMMIAAAVADLILLPALILGPLSRV